MNDADLEYELYFYSRYRWAWLAETLIWIDRLLWAFVFVQMYRFR